MCSNETYIPNREQRPLRYCTACSALLSSGNLMNKCWPCGKSWGEMHLTPNHRGDLLSDFMVAMADPVAA